MIERTIFSEEHDIFRQTVRRFVEREIVPFHAKWEEDGIVPRELWLKAGATVRPLRGIVKRRPPRTPADRSPGRAPRRFSPSRGEARRG